MNLLQSHTPRALAFAALALALGCGGRDSDAVEGTGESQLPPPAAALSGNQPGVDLRARLVRLEADLAAVAEGGLDDESLGRLLRAEAVTDRLLEDEPENAWLAAGYYVEARLRQIQALADRTVAQLRRGVAREFVLRDVAALRLSVADLIAQLAQPGNGAPPPPLDSLLAGYEDEPPLASARSGTAQADTTSTRTPAATPDPNGPLGQPIQP